MILFEETFVDEVGAVDFGDLRLRSAGSVNGIVTWVRWHDENDAVGECRVLGGIHGEAEEAVDAAGRRTDTLGVCIKFCLHDSESRVRRCNVRRERGEDRDDEFDSGFGHGIEKLSQKF